MTIHIKDREMLKSIIDCHGLKAVLQTIAEICLDKSLHLRENWQDELLAKVWSHTAIAVERVAHRTLEQM